jgi:F0F1-type ATP synthase assembly protein I
MIVHGILSTVKGSVCIFLPIFLFASILFTNFVPRTLARSLSEGVGATFVGE